MIQLILGGARSGKSLLAVFYVGLLREHPDLENPTVVVVTDRKDLDGQLYETFASCRIPLRTTPVQAGDRAELKKLLTEQVAGGIFFTTIQFLWCSCTPILQTLNYLFN